MKMGIIYFSVLLFFAPKAICEPEVWTPCPTIGQIAGSSIWYFSDIQISTLGRRKHLCTFGFKKKTGPKELDIIPILTLPCIQGIIYTWHIEKHVLVIKGNDRIVVNLELKLLEELAKRDKTLETEPQNDDDMAPENHIILEELDD